MKDAIVKIDFEQMSIAFREHVRSKAIKAGSTIVYSKNGQLIEEDPKTQKKCALPN